MKYQLNFKLRFSLLIALMLMLSSAFYGCGGSETSVRAKLAQKKPLESFAYANGTVYAEDIEEVYFDRGTRIDNVFVRVGDDINEDQRLVQYNSDKIKQSSIDGVVTQLTLRKGMVVDSDKPAIVIMDMTKLIIKADVKQSDIANVQQGQEVVIFGDALPKEKKVTGKVETISATAKQVDSQPFFEVGVRIDGQLPEALKAGMRVNCDIRLSRLENALVITYESVKNIGNEKYVFVVKGGKLEERKVTLGAAYGITVEVKDGITEGESVVLDPKPDFKTGMSVNVLSTEK